jgi:CRP-like cAMP-binding protein
LTQLEALKLFLKSFNILSEEEIDGLAGISTFKKLSKNDYFIKEGDTCKHITFVLSGILRSFYISDKEEEMTYCISFPNNFMTAYSSYLRGIPTLENIQAITSTELLVFPKDKLEVLTKGNYNSVFFLKTIAEQQYIELENRIFQLQGSDSASRYATLMKNHPKYLQHIPLQYLASFLGVSQRHLSRIRKEAAL